MLFFYIHCCCFFIFIAVVFLSAQRWSSFFFLLLLFFYIHCCCFFYIHCCCFFKCPALVLFLLSVDADPCGGRRSAKAQDFNGGAGSQEITSPDFPAWYWADTDCAWQVDSPANQRVVLQRQYVSLEHSDDCQFDYIEVADIGAGNATR